MWGHFGQESNASAKNVLFLFVLLTKTISNYTKVIIVNLRPKSYIGKLWTVHALSNQFKILGIWNIYQDKRLFSFKLPILHQKLSPLIIVKPSNKVKFEFPAKFE